MTENPYSVHRAEPRDADALYDFLLDHYYPEAAIQPVAERKVRSLIERCVTRDRGIAGVIWGAGGIEASIGLTVDEFDYTDAPHVEDRWIAVHSEHRRTQHAPNLLKFAKWAYGQLDVPIFLKILTHRRLMGKMRLLQRQMPQVGAFFTCAPLDQFYSQKRLGDGRLNPDV